MNRSILIFGIALVCLSCIGFLTLNVPSTQAKGIYFTDWDLRGTYASQLTGTVVFPQGLPGSELNGPYCLTGRVRADGEGHAEGTVYDNYNGVLLNYTWQGSYHVTPEGTLTLSTTLPLPGLSYSLVMFGVICDDGKMVRLTQIEPTMATLGIQAPGLPPNFLGTVISGSWVRQ